MILSLFFYISTLYTHAFSATINPFDETRHDAYGRPIGFHGHSVGNGGDFSAVQFISLVTEVANHLETNASPLEKEKILNKVSLQQFNTAIQNSILVISENGPFIPTHYQNESGFHVFKLSRENLTMAVGFSKFYNYLLHIYLEAMGIEDTNMVVSQYLNSELIYNNRVSLLTFLVTPRRHLSLSSWSSSGSEHTDSMLRQQDLKFQLKIALGQIVKHLKENPSKQEQSKILGNTSIEELEILSDRIHFKIQQTPPKDWSGFSRDAVHSSFYEITLYEEAWMDNMSSPYFYNLLLHECLWILGDEDTDYRVSRFLDSSAIYKENYLF